MKGETMPYGIDPHPSRFLWIFLWIDPFLFHPLLENRIAPPEIVANTIVKSLIQLSQKMRYA